MGREIFLREVSLQLALKVEFQRSKKGVTRQEKGMNKGVTVDSFMQYSYLLCLSPGVGVQGFPVQGLELHPRGLVGDEADHA